MNINGTGTVAHRAISLVDFPDFPLQLVVRHKL
jgi:hypothetical protein